MSSAFITKRNTKSGPRHVVRYRTGGFAFPIVHAGSFKTKKEAEERRVLIAHELANGRNPADALRQHHEPPAPPITLAAKFDEFIESKIDVGTSATSLYRNAQNRLGRLDVDYLSVRWQDVQRWIADDLGDLSPKTIRHYLSTLRQVLDFADVSPNPARDRRVQVPSLDVKEVRPPSRNEFDAIVAQLRNELVLPVRVMECTGLRVGELTKLVYGDVDWGAENRNPRIRVSKARTKGKAAGQRWIPIPPELVDEIDDLVPLDDRHLDRRVFPFTEPQVRDSLTRACKFAKLAHYHPHDLRHRRCSLWVSAHNMDPVRVKTWSGHGQPSMLLDTYSHVMLDPADEWAGFWRFAYAEGRGDVVPVWSRETSNE
jgi:integrase